MKPILSAVGLFATGSLIYLFKNYVSEQQNIIEKDQLKQILILLRKRFFTTLRQIAFIVNYIKANQTDFQPKKISDIIMKDGGSGDIKLNLIQSITLQSYNLTKQSFQASCNFHKQNDYQIRILLRNLTLDIQLALKGNIQSYQGPLMNFSSEKIINIYREILRRRMENIKLKFIDQASDKSILQRQFEIQQFLQMSGVKLDKQSNQKIFIAMLELKYHQDFQFRIHFQNLQVQMQDYVQQIQSKHQLKLQNKRKQQKTAQLNLQDN